jgi:hypothetical protein
MRRLSTASAALALVAVDAVDGDAAFSCALSISTYGEPMDDDLSVGSGHPTGDHAAAAIIGVVTDAISNKPPPTHLINFEDKQRALPMAIVPAVQQPYRTKVTVLDRRLGQRPATSRPLNSGKNWKSSHRYAPSKPVDNAAILLKEEIPLVFAQTYNPYVVLGSISKHRDKIKVDNTLSQTLFPSHKSFHQRQLSSPDLTHAPKDHAYTKVQQGNTVLNSVGIVDTRYEPNHACFANSYFVEHKLTVKVPRSKVVLPPSGNGGEAADSETRDQKKMPIFSMSDDFPDFLPLPEV